MEKNGTISLIEASVNGNVTFAYIMTFQCISVHHDMYHISYLFLLTVDVRLVNGSNAADVTSGRVEVLYNHVWGTICDNAWGTNDAIVLCRQLGLPYGNAHAVGNAAFGQGSGPIWLNNVTCSGKESSLAECIYSVGGNSSCTHGEDAGIVCTDGE